MVELTFETAKPGNCDDSCWGDLDLFAARGRGAERPINEPVTGGLRGGVLAGQQAGNQGDQGA